jgi:hypothetical protein
VGAVAEAVLVSIVAEGIRVAGNGVIVSGVSVMVVSVANGEVAVVDGAYSVVWGGLFVGVFVNTKVPPGDVDEGGGSVVGAGEGAPCDGVTVDSFCASATNEFGTMMPTNIKSPTTMTHWHRRRIGMFWVNSPP